MQITRKGKVLFTIDFPKSPRQIIFLAALFAVSIINCVELIQDLPKVQKIKKHFPNRFIGFKFSGLEQILEGQEFVGYYTDKDLDDSLANQQYSQAQFILAPIILDVNNTEHEYVLLDCSSLEIAKRVIKNSGLVPLKSNKYGIILAQNKR